MVPRSGVVTHGLRWLKRGDRVPMADINMPLEGIYLRELCPSRYNLNSPAFETFESPITLFRRSAVADSRAACTCRVGNIVRHPSIQYLQSLEVSVRISKVSPL